MTKPEPEVRAQRREIRESAGSIWWEHFIQSNSSQIARRERQVGVVYWTLAERMPIDLFSYIREASRCFTVAQFLASVTMASCAVELILNRDRRLRSNTELKRIGGWATLNNRNLIIAANSGIPSASLCSADESLQQSTQVTFVKRRNKVAHGEVLPMLQTLSDYDAQAEEEALDQIVKAQQFVVEWFNTAPDVQEGYILNHQWPNNLSLLESD